MRIYTYQNCDSCRKATKWLTARGLTYEERPIRETPPTISELEQMLEYQEGDVRRLFNTAGADYRALGLKDALPKLTTAEALALLASRGNLVKRPFLLGSGFGLVGFKAEVWSEKVAGA